MEFEEMLKQVMDFEHDLHRYNYNNAFQEFSFSRGLKNYQNIIKRLKSINLPDPNTFKYTTLSLDELKEYLTTILNKIFSSKYSDIIEEYHQMISLEPISNPFDAILEKEIIDDTAIIKKFHLSSKLASIEVAATAHEYIHALLAKYTTFKFNDILSNIHYNELLSILIEYITIYELSKILKKDQLTEKHNIIRIHNCQEQAISDEENHFLLPKLKKRLSFDPFVSDGIDKSLSYSSHNSFGYIISDIYAYQLFNFYLDDPKTLINIFTAIIDGENSIDNLLKYYNISLRNKDLVADYTKRLAKLSN